MDEQSQTRLPHNRPAGQPYTTTDEAWTALQEQRGMSDGEAVDLWTHQVQAAMLLRQQGADDEVVVAGLLHDLGDGRVAEKDHSAWAAAMLRPLLGERVAWLVGAHAEAKRYMCTVDPDYWQNLSPVSQQTLLRQGGHMTPDEVAAFAAHPWAQDALWLRRCDDAGKDPELATDNLQSFRPALERVAAQARNNS